MDEMESLRAELALARDAVGRWKRSAETWAAMHRDDTSTLDAKLQRLRAEVERLTKEVEAYRLVQGLDALARAEKAEAKVARVEALADRLAATPGGTAGVIGWFPPTALVGDVVRDLRAALRGDDVTYHEAGSFTSGEGPSADGGLNA